MYKQSWVLMVLLVSLGTAAHSFGATFVVQPWATDTSTSPPEVKANSTDPGAVNATYPGYLTRAVLPSPPPNGPGTSPDAISEAYVTAGELHLDSEANGTISFITQGLDVFDESVPFTVSVNARGTAGAAGNYSLGLVIGNRAFGFFPNYSDANFKHLMRWFDPGGGLTRSDILRFNGDDSTPVPGTITGGPNLLTVQWNGAGTWTYSFASATGGSVLWTFSDSGSGSTAFVMDEIGVFSRSDTGLGDAIFDNLYAAIPEPGAAGLLLVAAASGMLSRWSRRRGLSHRRTSARCRSIHGSLARSRLAGQLHQPAATQEGLCRGILRRERADRAVQ